jgi:streptogramin lyase
MFSFKECTRLGIRHRDFKANRSAGPWVHTVCLGFILVGLTCGAAHAQVVTEFGAGITGGATPLGITTGPDGNIWFTEEAPIANRIGRITPLGILTEFSAGITALSLPHSITAGPDGNLWFTEGNRIGRITPAGVVTEFSAGITAIAGLLGITAGPDGNLWFTEAEASRIGRITPFGVVTEFNLTPATRPGGITAGPDGNLWFTEFDGNRVGRITPLGVVTEFNLTPATGPGGIAAGPDGNLWFTEMVHNRIGRITPLGVVTEFSAGISADAGLAGITAGPDGNLWFTEGFGNRIGRITPLGVVTEFPSFGDFVQPNGIAAGPDGGMWFTVISGSGNLGDAIGRITTGPVSATSFHTTAPCRVLDTRNATGALGGPALAAGVKRDFVVIGTCGIPAAAVSISANVAITEPTSAGTLLALPAQLPVVAFRAGMTRANNVFLLLAADDSGAISFSNDMPSGTVQLIVDVNGWWQ